MVYKRKTLIFLVVVVIGLPLFGQDNFLIDLGMGEGVFSYSRNSVDGLGKFVSCGHLSIRYLTKDRPLVLGLGVSSDRARLNKKKFEDLVSDESLESIENYTKAYNQNLSFMAEVGTYFRRNRVTFVNSLGIGYNLSTVIGTKTVYFDIENNQYKSVEVFPSGVNSSKFSFSAILTSSLFVRLYKSLSLSLSIQSKYIEAMNSNKITVFNGNEQAVASETFTFHQSALYHFCVMGISIYFPHF